MRCRVCFLMMMVCGVVAWAESSSEAQSASADTNQVSAGVELDSGFDRFRTISDRMPFGPDPVGFDPEIPSSASQPGGGAAEAGTDPAQQSEEAQRLLAAVRVCMLNVTPSGKMAVGFTDTSVQPSKNYYLKVGDTRDGWLVKSADFSEKKVVLEKDGVEAELGVGESTGGGDAKKKGPALAGGRRNMKADAPPALGSGIASLRARRLKQLQAAEERQSLEQERQRKAEERARQEQERVAAERQQVQEEREQQRQQLLAIQEELRLQREQREAERANETTSNANENVE